MILLWIFYTILLAIFNFDFPQIFLLDLPRHKPKCSFERRGDVDKRWWLVMLAIYDVCRLWRSVCWFIFTYIYDVYNLRNIYRIHFYMFLFSWISYNSFCCDYEECNLLSISSGTLVQFVFFLGNHSTSFGGFRYAWYDSTPYYEPEGFHV